MTLEEVRRWTASRPTLADALGMEITAVHADYLEGRMPVDGRTHQPMGLLHGGASVALAETLGSIAAARHEGDTCGAQPADGRRNGSRRRTTIRRGARVLRR